MNLFRRKDKWRRIDSEEVVNTIDDEPSKVRIRRYHRCQKHYEWKLEKDRFLSVIFLDSKELTGFLTDDYDARGIWDIAERKVTGRPTFESLIGEQNLESYNGCLKIESERFDYAEFGTIWLRGATNFERPQIATRKISHPRECS